MLKPTKKEIIECLQWGLQVIEDQHYKCNVASDEECWDDGPVLEHGFIRQAKEILNKV